MSVWIETNKTTGWRQHQRSRYSLDEVSPTVMAYGMGQDTRSHWFICCDDGPVGDMEEWLMAKKRAAVMVEGANGFAESGGHEYLDVTDSPAPTVQASRAVHVQVTPGEAPDKSPADKPPYRVPTMEEIAKVEPNGLTAISTFSGCGGSSLGYKMAGFKVLWANEFIPAAQDTYAANHKDTILDRRDIRKVKPAEILAAIGLKAGELDLFDGSPPCASFSTAGKREEHWGQVKKYSDTQQRVDDLFFEYIRLLKGLQPRVFVAENVSGLIKGVAKGTFLEILGLMKAAGYRVACRLLDAQWLGVPQMRQRTIFIGVREDLGIEPVHPKPLPYRYSVREAIPWIIKCVHDTYGERSAGDVTNRPSPCVTPGNGSGHSQSRGKEVPLDEPAPTVIAGNQISGGHQFVVENDGPALDEFAIGAEWDKIKPGEQSEKYFNLVKPDQEQPSPTILAQHGNPGMAGVVHPTEKRKFTIAELRRICAFPDDFVLTGTYQQQWERLGRAVPPVMMFHVARTLRDEVFAKMPPKPPKDTGKLRSSVRRGRKPRPA